MQIQNQTLLIFSGVCSLLFLASLSGHLLRVRARGTAAAAGIEDLNERIHGWWGITLIVGGGLLAGPTVATIFFALISFVALREFFTLTSVRGADHQALLAIYLIALPVQYAAIALGWHTLFVALIPVCGFVIVPFLTALSCETENFLARTAELLWALVLCVYGVSHVPALLMLNIAGYQGRQVLLMVFLILVTQSSDVLQYLWGKLFGRHPVAPALSPSKTVEGLVGGIVCATTLGAALWWITPFTIPQAGAMAFVIAVAGFLGGLVMSAIKRDRGVKDWSQLIKGHGGILDRLDSICFSAPLFFHLTRFFFQNR